VARLVKYPSNKTGVDGAARACTPAEKIMLHCSSLAAIFLFGPALRSFVDRFRETLKHRMAAGGFGHLPGQERWQPGRFTRSADRRHAVRGHRELKRKHPSLMIVWDRRTILN
jgi:hypothetical protein